MLSLALALLPVLPLQEAPATRGTPLQTRIEEVTIFPGQALLRRVGEAPARPARLIVAGLPGGLDAGTLRARCRGGDVLGLETRRRIQAEVPTERLEALRARLRELDRRRQGLTDERSLADDVKGHLQRLLRVEEAAHADDLERARVDTETWSANLAYISEQLAGARKQLRELEWQIEDLDIEIAAVQAELGRSQSLGGQERVDVHLDVVPRGEAALVIELEYLVAGAGWAPLYDLRTATDARSVELSYRAQVWQRTGEDWQDAEILLSTARPNLGAQGPDPRPVWLSLRDPGSRSRASGAAPAARKLGYAEGEDADAPAEADALGLRFASVESQGLSVRYRLPRRETIESREEASTVLVGQARLESRPEYHVVPSLDTNVWLRGVASNSSPWTLLPGKAAVFFGADFVGEAQLDLVMPGAELVLHLGADPALTVERAQTEDMKKGPGIFGSRETQSETWRVRVENHGAAAAGPDGGVHVIVREALPRSTDERIQVELAMSNPKPAGGERWQKELEEEGVRAWILSVPRGGEAQLEYQLKLSYPQGMRLGRTSR